MIKHWPLKSDKPKQTPSNVWAPPYTNQDLPVFVTLIKEGYIKRTRAHTQTTGLRSTKSRVIKACLHKNQLKVLAAR